MGHATTQASRPVVATGATGLLADLRRGHDRLFCVGRRADRLCRDLDQALARYRQRKVPPLRALLRAQLPAQRPDTVVYPFSGGDVLTALSAFPHQRRYVLLSLEQGGSPAPIAHMSKAQSRRARRRFLWTSRRMLINDFSHTVDLQEPTGRRIPGLLPLMLLGLRAHQAQLTGLRTFRITAKGQVVYFSAAELERSGEWPRGEKGARFGRLWSDPQYNQPYSHVELRFRLPGDSQDRVMQHLAADLSDPGLKQAPGLDAFLAGLGPHNLMIKAASYLLWKARYSQIRQMLLHRAALLVADTSAPYPNALREAGLEVRLFGRFRCPMVRSYRKHAGPWRAEFKRQKPAPLPFRFGYTDCRRRKNLVLGIRR